MNVFARVENRIWSDADSAHEHVEIRVSSEGVVFSKISTSGGALLIGKLCLVDCVLLAILFEKSCARGSAQVSWRCCHRPWFVGALGAPGSSLAYLMPSEWDGPPSVTEGVGNPTAE